VNCWPIDFKFPTWQAAEGYAQGQYEGTKQAFRVLDGALRIEDVYNRDAALAVEVKTGQQGVTARTFFQFSADAELLKSGGGYCPTGTWLPINDDSLLWNFYPNASGLSNPSVPLLEALSTRGIEVNIYQYNPGEDRQPLRLPFVSPFPVPESSREKTSTPIAVPVPVGGLAW
jgi:hypothetical protein